MKSSLAFLMIAHLFFIMPVCAEDDRSFEILSSKSNICDSKDGEVLFWSSLKIKNNKNEIAYIPMGYLEKERQNFFFPGFSGLNEITAGENVLYTNQFTVGSWGGGL